MVVGDILDLDKPANVCKQADIIIARGRSIKR